MNHFFLTILSLIFISCSTTTPQTDKLMRSKSFPKKAKIENVPFTQQDANHCGPATLKMVLDFKGKEVDLKELTSTTFTPGGNGTYQTDMMSAVRRQKMIPVSISTLRTLLTEIKSGNPVIVFENLGLKAIPKWHYAVVTGYDLNGPDIFLHSGSSKDLKIDMRLFERNWKLADFWGMVILSPGELSPTATDVDHIKGAAGLEQLKHFSEAEKSYKSLLTRQPESLLALIGMGNVEYEKKNYQAAAEYLSRATKAHPESAMAWHNLAEAQGMAGYKLNAEISAKRALELVDADQKENYKNSLKPWLKKK